MKTYHQYISELHSEFTINESNEDDIEKQFIELSHINELEIKFDFDDWSDYLFYFYNKSEIFDNDKRLKYFYINNKIWKHLENEFNLEYVELSYIMDKIIEKHFNLKDVSASENVLTIIDKVEKHFKR